MMTLSLYDLMCMGWDGFGNPRQWYIQHMRDFKGPRFQRGVLHPIGFYTPAGNPDTLTLNALSSTGADISAPWSSDSGVRVLRDGTVEELSGLGVWEAQNSGVEYIDNNDFDVGDDYEVMLSGTGDLPTSGPALDAWWTINVTRQWRLTKTVEGIFVFTGTMDIREIADTGNSVSASATLRCENQAL